MHLNASFALLLLALAVVQAVPTTRIEKKSLVDEEPKIEEAGDDKDRSKKSTFCVKIGPEAQQNQDSTNVQSFNLVPQQSQTVPQIQTYNFQSAPQPVQAMSVIQSAPVVSQQSYVFPQQVVPPVHTLQIVQQPQPCPQQTSVNIIERQIEATAAPKTEIVTQAPAPVAKPEPKPEKIIAPEPQRMETINIVPVERPCNDKLVVVPPKPMVVIPEPTVVKVPHCPHHSHECNCVLSMGSLKNVNTGANHMSYMTIGEYPYEVMYRNHMHPDEVMRRHHVHPHHMAKLHLKMQYNAEFRYRTMHLNASFAVLLLALAMAQAVPATRIEKKSLTEDAIELEEVDDVDDNDRSKKSTFLVDVRPAAENQESAKISLQSEGQSAVQTFNLIPQQCQTAPQIQTYNFQSAPQPVQAMSVIQSAPMVHQHSYVIPQQVVPPVHTLQIVQQPQPCPQQASVNIIERQIEATAAPETEIVTQPPAPKPKPEPKPEKIIAPEPQRMETINFVPVERPCNDKLVVVPPKPMVVIPEPTVVKVPHCPHHSHNCNCMQHGASFLQSVDNGDNHMSFMTMAERPYDVMYRNHMHPHHVAEMQSRMH
ncbi:uncharacterized protein LOC143346088 [Colletes latitarsis]|uniref:uncharacterized protein LOC143346088 n=1 Tax=Colletes latitarsis TaxID=2605962 RepID=UPI004037260D